MKKKLLCVLVVILLVLSTLPLPTAADHGDVTYSSAGYVQVPLGRGINFTCLEMSEYKPEDYILERRYYTMVRDRGFDHIRLPVNFSLYCDENGLIGGEIFEKVDRAVSLALEEGLYVVLDMHGCGDINSNADGTRQKLLYLWKQVAEHYAGYGEGLLFELLNEPNTGGDGAVSPLDAEKLNEIQNELIALIRESNPDRVLIAAVADNNTVGNLAKLRLPEDDKNIITTVHIYNPMRFTHQGASWSSSADYPKCSWEDSFANELQNVVSVAAAYQKESGRQVWVGEFGVCLNVAEHDDAAKYIQTIRRMFEENGLGWCYWEFWMSFGAFDRGTGAWREYVVNSLIPFTAERIDTAYAKPSDLYLRSDAEGLYDVSYTTAVYDGSEQNAAVFTLTAAGAASSRRNLSFTTFNEANHWKAWDFDRYPNAVLRLWLQTDRAMQIQVSVQQTGNYQSFTTVLTVAPGDAGRMIPFDLPVSVFRQLGMTERFNVMFINPVELTAGERITVGNLEYWSATPAAQSGVGSVAVYGSYYPYADANYSMISDTGLSGGEIFSVKRFAATVSGAENFSGQLLSGSMIKYELYTDAAYFADFPDGYLRVLLKLPHPVRLRIAAEDGNYRQQVIFDDYTVDAADGYTELRIPAERLAALSGRLLYFYIGRASGATPQNGEWLSEGEEIVLSALALYEKSPTFYYDVNRDGDVDIRDLISLKKHLAAGSDLGDVNHNGTADLRDAVLLRQRLLGISL